MGPRNNPSGLAKCVAEILRERADALNFSYRTLEERSGVSKTKLQAIFTGERTVLLSDLDAIAEALGLVGWKVVRDAELALAEEEDSADFVKDAASNMNKDDYRRASSNPGYVPDEEFDQ